MPELRVPRDEASRAAQGQLCAFVQLVSRAIGAEALDLLQVKAGAAVLHAAISSPDPEHIFGGGWGCCSKLFGLMFHRAWFP
jgi:hypothetical protein